MRVFVRVLVVAAVGLGALPLSSTPAGAAPSFHLTRQTPWALLEGAVELDLTIVDTPLDATVRATIHSAILSRSAFDLALEGEGLDGESTVHDAATSVADLPAIGSSERRLTLRLADADDPEPDDVPVTEPGVYPMEVSLEIDGDDESSFVTFLVVVDGDGSGPSVGERLGVAWVWPLDAEPALTDDGDLTPRSLAELAEGGRLGRQVAALAATRVPVTVAPGGLTVAQWLASELPTRTALADAVSAPNQVVSNGYVPLDLPSLLGAGLRDAAAKGLLEGTAALEEALGAGVDTRTALALPVDDEAFAMLTDADVDRMVVATDDLETVAAELTPARPFELVDDGRVALAATGDPGLAELLDGPGDPALRAQQFLATLALVASEAPSLTRGVMVVNPPSWDPEPEFLSAALAGVASHPMLEPMTLDRYFDDMPPSTDGGATLERTIDARSPTPPPVSASTYRDADRRQAAFRSFAGPSSDRLVPGDRALLISLASTWGPNSPGAARQLALVDETLDTFLDEIHVPVDTTITLTARTGSIPLQFVNETGQEVTVRVTLASDRLDFPDGATRDIVLAPSPTASTEEFQVETLTSGRFPLGLTVSSPDGELVVSSSRIDVRSTAVSGVGIFLTLGAGVVLAGWWFNDLRRRRRSRRRSITATEGADSGE